MPTKKILVLGATGATGQHVVAQALQRGFAVTVLVRDRQKLTATADQLRVVVGTLPDDTQALAAAVSGQDAVISALGVGNSLKSNGLIARSAPVIMHAMERGAVRRLIFTSAYGVGTTYQDVPFLPRIFIRTLLRDLYADKAASEEIIRRSGLNWTLVYPATLTNGPATGKYRAGERLALRGFPRISRADVAEFLVSQVDGTAYLRKGVLIGP